MQSQFANTSMASSQSRYLHNSNEHQAQSANRRRVLLKNQGSHQNGQPQSHSVAKNQRAGPIGNHMDILKKFRYNFHYWLRNCYQAEEGAHNNGLMDIYHKAEDVISKTDQIIGSGSAQNSPLKNHNQSAPVKQSSTKLRGDPQLWPQSKLNAADVAARKNGTADQAAGDQAPSAISPGAAAKIRDLTGTPDGFLPASITNGKKIRPDKYMVLQMGQSNDDRQDQALIQYLSSNALAIQHHPGAVQFQVSKQMLATLKKKFGNMKAIIPKQKEPSAPPPPKDVENAALKDVAASKQAYGGAAQPPQLHNSAGQYLKKLGGSTFPKQFSAQQQPPFLK